MTFFVFFLGLAAQWGLTAQWHPPLKQKSYLKPADTFEFWFARDTLPPNGGAYMHKSIHALLLRRPDAEIDKAVKENRWKDAYELEIKHHQEAIVSIVADVPSFAEPATHPRGRPPPCNTKSEYPPPRRPTTDEYVEDPDEKNIRVVLHGPRLICINETTGMPPPPGYDGPLHRVEIVGPPPGKGRGKAWKGRGKDGKKT